MHESLRFGLSEWNQIQKSILYKIPFRWICNKGKTDLWWKNSEMLLLLNGIGVTGKLHKGCYLGDRTVCAFANKMISKLGFANFSVCT